MEVSIATERVEWPGCDIIADHSVLTANEWRALRRSGIGGSDAGAVMQLSKYASALTVCMEKTGRSEGFEGNEATEVGNILEPLIREHVVVDYARQLGYEVERIGEAPHVYRSRQWPWMLANIDGYVVLSGQQVGLEIKTGGSYQLREWGGVEGNELPDAYWAQVQHYMAVTGTDRWLVFGLIGNRRLVREVTRSEAWIADMVAEEEQVWHAIQDNDPLRFPAPIGLYAEDEALRQIGKPIDDSAHADLSAVEGAVDRYYSIGKELKDLEALRKQAQQTIRAAMGTAATATAGRYEIKRTHYTKQQFDHGRFAKDHPEAIKDYMREVEIDYPRVKEMK